MTDKLRMPRLLGFYSRYVEDRDTAAFVKDVLPRYNGGTLQRLAQHSRREVRRGAVFALGLIGEYETNHTLGCALLDADRTVRAWPRTASVACGCGPARRPSDGNWAVWSVSGPQGGSRKSCAAPVG